MLVTQSLCPSSVRRHFPPVLQSPLARSRQQPPTHPRSAPLASRGPTLFRQDAALPLPRSPAIARPRHPTSGTGSRTSSPHRQPLRRHARRRAPPARPSAPSPTHRPLSISHIRNVLSVLAEIARRPSGVTLTLLTWPLCPSSVASKAGLGFCTAPGGQRRSKSEVAVSRIIACAES